MFGIDSDLWDLCLSLGLILFVGIVFLFSFIKYKKIMRNKTVGDHENLARNKINKELKVCDYEKGYHIYFDKEKRKFAIVIDNPKSCNIYSVESLEEYVLTIDGEAIPRSSSKDLITEFKARKATYISLDIFTAGNKFRFNLLEKEHKVEDIAFKNRYSLANSFCDILDMILYNK